MEKIQKKTKQMKLNHFCREFDIPRSTALEWIHSKGFPGYRLAGHWYIDIEEYYTWRVQEHIKCYKYA